MDWSIAGDLQLSDATSHRIAKLPEKTTSYFLHDRFLVSRGFCLGFHPRSNRLRDLHTGQFGSTGGPEVKDKFDELKFILR